MRKGWNLFTTFAIFLFLLVGTVSAFNESSTEKERIDAAYSCLKEKIDQRSCYLLGVEEKVFSLLSTGECKTELLSDSRNNQCWPSSSCSVKSTAKAILALDGVKENTTAAEAWLLNQKRIPEDLVWYLEIDSNEAMSCIITYGGTEYSILIGEDKLITTGNTGNCLDVIESGYWLTISPTDSCYAGEFEISCDENFLTTLLFRKGNSETIHVLNTVNTATAGGTTLEQINAFCFSVGNSCNYDGSLWATFVLGALGHDISSYMPYLITSYSDNKPYFPEPLLYMLTDDVEYRTNLLTMQINREYWSVSNNKYYGTALALLPFQSRESPNEKDLAKDWLFKIQQEDGCWDGENINSNAFLLYSIWPKILGGDVPSPDPDPDPDPTPRDNDTDVDNDTDNDCKLSEYFCMYAVDCEGNLLSDYECAGASSCCDEKFEEKSCSYLLGEICSSDKYCDGGNELETSDTFWGEKCCVGGTCEEKTSDGGDDVPKEYTCEINSGVCEDFSCDSGYYELTRYTCEYDAVCCISDGPDPEPPGKNYWWLWILFILIILVVVAIIYRDKLKEIMHKKDDKDKRLGSRFEHNLGRMPPSMPVQRKIIRRPIPRPSIQRGPMQRKPRPKTPAELDDVLKKLKNMSK